MMLKFLSWHYAGVIVGACISYFAHAYIEEQKSVEGLNAVVADFVDYVPSGNPGTELAEYRAHKNAKEMARCKALEMDEHMSKERKQ